MKTAEAVVKRVERLAGQKRDPLARLEHLEKSFETHNDRVDAGVEMYKVYFDLRGNYIDVVIINDYDDDEFQYLKI